MKRTLGSLYKLNRRSLLILGLVLGIAGFGTIAWNVDAQDSSKDTRWTQEEAAMRAALKAERMALSEQENVASKALQLDTETIAGANELLVVNLTTANQITITATSAASAATRSGSTVTGFYFQNIFANAGTFTFGATTLVSGNLTAASVPTDNSPLLFRATNDPGLNVWSYSATGTTTFTAGQTAFTGAGTWTITPAAYTALLTAPTTGNVYFPADDVADLPTATLLGTYRVILPGGATPTPTSTPTATPTATATPPGGQPIADGGFEANSGAPVVTNPNWQSTSTAFTTSLCTVAACGTGGGAAAPRGGNGWLWLGGTTAAESGSGSQSVVLPVGSNPMLKYFLRIGTVTAPFNATFRVLVDGVQQIQITEPATAEATYTERTINLNAFANGAAHVIRFEYTNPAGSGTSNFVIDDVRIDTAGVGTPTPTNTPTSTPTSTPTATPTGTPAGTPTPTATPTGSPTATPTPPPGSCTAANTTLYAYDFTTDDLVRFTAANPATYSSVLPITGLAANEFLTGIDFRPANGIMYGTVSNFTATLTRTVAINLSGQLVNVGSNLPGTADVFFGMDFNPVPDRIRLIGDADTSRRINPDNGTLAGTDTNVAYVVGDPGFGSNPNIVHVAYTNSVAGATLTTLYGIDSVRDTLVRIGGPDGTPSPNLGALTTIGPLGVDTASFGGFDIQPGTNTAYAALRVGGVQRLYTINLATGAATLIGNIGAGANNIDGLTVAPCVTAAGVEVSGRVLTPDGHGLRNAVVSMTDNSGVVRTATTSTFGYYRFDDVSVGESYIMSVNSRRYRFSPRVVQVFDSMADVDFTGQD